MIICITDRCRMNCSHCMDNCVYSDTNSFMDEKTFISSLKFVLDIIGCKLVIISGGEPTEHPDFVNYMYIANDYAKCYNAAICVCTNGMNFNDEHILEQIKEFESNGSNVMYQVTNDKRYYPVDVTNIIDNSVFNMENVVYCDNIEVIYPMGRAVQNNIPYQAKASKCFNIRSLTRHQGSLSKAVKILEGIGKFCTPLIDPSGYIRLGESLLCDRIDDYTVNDVIDDISRLNDIENDICNFKCNNEQCHKILQILPVVCRNAIGEQ